MSLSYDLLKRHLTPKQLRQYDAAKRIVVRGSSGRIFTVPQTAGFMAPECTPEHMITVYGGGGKYIEHWCVGLSKNCGREINLLALKMQLELDDWEVEKELKRHGGMGVCGKALAADFYESELRQLEEE